ncbi:copper transporter 6-like [Senna tora]|uniref:Copper transport protein n=1 Tax=Senna tora TaxID=362788 RepID=A0A834W5Z7_9FABA|nr:copper transporter 6-like [Senna tora]
MHASSSSMNGTGGGMGMGHKMMMHMTFFWGTKVEILFHGWPADSTAMYALALFVIFVMAFLVECLSQSRFLINKAGSNHFLAALVQTATHAIRVGLAYLLMLALMSFNAGVFLVAVAGHAFGFFCFASSAFHKQEYQKGFNNLAPPLSC